MSVIAPKPADYDTACNAVSRGIESELAEVEMKMNELLGDNAAVSRLYPATAVTESTPDVSRRMSSTLAVTASVRSSDAASGNWMFTRK